jgi:hypothetical protein
VDTEALCDGVGQSEVSGRVLINFVEITRYMTF